MQLTPQELHWLPYWGATGKLAMRKACWLNRDRRSMIEQTFESIANTRVNLLMSWAQTQWDFLQDAAFYLATKPQVEHQETLLNLKGRALDYSELFIIDSKGRVQESTYSAHKGEVLADSRVMERALEKPFLHGPYKDPRTLNIGASSSAFHDQVTLMFYQPLVVNDQVVGCLCGRIPNDVMSDIIQREAGHIYNESGDNYIFMVKSELDSTISPGTALSRSRFEDNTFSHGENLKSGIHTKWGTVKINQHTEFEIRFTDPATNQLHPGVRETIRNGSNLYVDYPGYSDYRHIPVIGKGVTFQLPGSPDRWGMMCEADLEEVYRHRSMSWSLGVKYAAGLFISLAITLGISHGFALGLIGQILLGLGVVGFSSWAFTALAGRQVSRQLREMTQVIQTLAEGDGNLKQRLDTSRFKPDESGDMGRWINSFIDNLEGIIRDMVHASGEVQQVSESMMRRCQVVDGSTQATSESIEAMLGLAHEQLHEIQNATVSAQTMRDVMTQVVEGAQSEYQHAVEGTAEIRSIVEASAQSVNGINAQMKEIGDIVQLIGEITDQTNLLALNAAIEAARAGEHGRGFSVVADEVRSLAGKTAQAANHIGALMNKLRAETETAVSYMEQGVKNVDQQSMMLDSGQSNQQLKEAVDGMFDTIQHIANNSERHADTARAAQATTTDLELSSQQLARRTTLVKNAIARLHQMVGRFDISQAV